MAARKPVAAKKTRSRAGDAKQAAPRGAAVTTALAKLLADSYTLYLKTHNFHWNVTGPMFTTLHALFMTQYTELALAVDEIAERMRSLGARAPGSYAEFAGLTSVEESREAPRAEDMLRQLVDDQAKIVRAARAVLAAAERRGDDATVDLAVRRLDVHEKNAWMLRSHLEV
jgi:starvation-inducible DNA-binding protein